MSAETKYRVIAQVEFAYEVFAETPEGAAAQVDQGDAGQGSAESAWVTAVVAMDDYWREHDLRAPRPCSGGCGKQIPAADTNPCPSCFMAELTAKAAS